MRTFLMTIVVFALGCAGSAAKVERPSAPARPELGEYRIQAGDQLEIRFPLNPELNVDSLVRPDGKISPKLIDEVYAEGRTPLELTEHLRNAY
ncbi:MAG: polysaccharide biosynthesis/export family protein, partial [Myxococcota bacterium]